MTLHTWSVLCGTLQEILLDIHMTLGLWHIEHLHVYSYLLHIFFVFFDILFPWFFDAWTPLALGARCKVQLQGWLCASVSSTKPGKLLELLHVAPAWPWGVGLPWGSHGFAVGEFMGMGIQHGMMCNYLRSIYWEMIRFHVISVWEFAAHRGLRMLHFAWWFHPEMMDGWWLVGSYTSQCMGNYGIS